MNRQIISASRLITFEQLRRNWLSHEDRLIHIKPTLNTRYHHSRGPTSRKYNYPKSLDIELQNKALLKKLTDKVDHRNENSMCTTFSLPKSNRKKYYDDYKIKSENEGLYKRLRETKAIIDTERMEVERRNTERYLNSISKFGYKGLKPTKTLVKFEMRNNDLKYLSKRRILIKSSANNDKENYQSSRLSPSGIIEVENKKMRNNQRLARYFSRPRQLSIDHQPVFLKITEGSRSIGLQLKRSGESDGGAELQVKISRHMFESKFQADLQLLINSLKYNSESKVFYIL